MKIFLEQIKCPIDYTQQEFLEAVNLKAQKSGINSQIPIESIEINKKAIDARKKSELKYVFNVTCYIDENLKEELSKSLFIKKNQISVKRNPVVVGSGPAGLFAALEMAVAGLCPIIIERGEEVLQRVQKVNEFWEKGNLDLESNVQFGEGGAGTFSDGKLVSGIKNPLCRVVLETFVEAGAPKEILYNSKPHIGTDLLRPIVMNIRNKLIDMGAQVMFSSKLVEIKVNEGKLHGITVEQKTKQGIVNLVNIETDNLVLAIGHSARDTIKSLYYQGVKMTQKPFSVGLRIEHLQKDINRAMYGEQDKKISSLLPAAEYKLSTKTSNNRSAYTFCMCPGGRVIASSSNYNQVVTNGMSYNGRDEKNSNSALLVNITPEDFKSDDVLAGFKFQENLEEIAYKAAGENYYAPISTVGDFLKNISHYNASRFSSKKDIDPTYSPGVKQVSLEEILPGFVSQSLKEALLAFDKKIDGFANPNAILTAIETRSSSPVRIFRNENFQSNILGVYPCGEGAGYAGGIMSASVDGIKCAQAIISKNKNV